MRPSNGVSAPPSNNVTSVNYPPMFSQQLMMDPSYQFQYYSAMAAAAASALTQQRGESLPSIPPVRGDSHDDEKKIEQDIRKRLDAEYEVKFLHAKNANVKPSNVKRNGKPEVSQKDFKPVHQSPPRHSSSRRSSPRHSSPRRSTHRSRSRSPRRLASKRDNFDDQRYSSSSSSSSYVKRNYPAGYFNYACRNESGPGGCTRSNCWFTHVNKKNNVKDTKKSDNKDTSKDDKTKDKTVVKDDSIKPSNMNGKSNSVNNNTNDKSNSVNDNTNNKSITPVKSIVRTDDKQASKIAHDKQAKPMNEVQVMQVVQTNTTQVVALNTSSNTNDNVIVTPQMQTLLTDPALTNLVASVVTQKKKKKKKAKTEAISTSTAASQNSNNDTNTNVLLHIDEIEK